MKRILLVPVLGLFLLIISCGSAELTQVKHGNDFSNLRSEVVLKNGSKYFGYATLEKGKHGTDKLWVSIPGSRQEKVFSIVEVEKMVAEDQEFVVKQLITPAVMVKEGYPNLTTSMVKRISEPHSLVQVYEYKYGVKNPKSPIKSLHTTWFVSFPDDKAGLPLTEFSSFSFKSKWDKWAGGLAKENGSQVPHPGNIKQLLSAVKQLENTPNSLSVGNLTK